MTGVQRITAVSRWSVFEMCCSLVVIGSVCRVTGGVRVGFWGLDKRFTSVIQALTGVIGYFGGPIAVLRKVSDKEYEQRSDRVCSLYTKGEINRKAPLWPPAGLGCMRL
jgi:hypothetical protein